MMQQSPHSADADDVRADAQGGSPWNDALESLGHGVGLVDHESRVVFANGSFARLVGADARDLVGVPFRDLVAPEDRDRVSSRLASGSGPVEYVRIAARGAEAVYVDLVPGRRAEGDASPMPVSVFDVSRRRESRLAERTRQRLLESHVERTPLAVIEWRLDRSIRNWNPSAERIFGYTFEEVDSRDMFPLIVEESSREMVDRVWERLVTNTGGEISVNTNVTKDGRIIQCRWMNTSLTDDEGNVVGVASLAEDITERIEAQRELSEARARLQRLVDELPVLIWAFDEKMVPVFWNAHAERVTGYPASVIIGNTDFYNLVHPSPEFKESFLRTWEALDYGDFDDIEIPTSCADGTIRWILLSNIAARCPIPGWSAWGVAIDVTDRRKAFEALRESERRYRDIIENADLAGIIVDERGGVLFANDFFRRLTGVGDERIDGVDCRELFNPPRFADPVDTGGVLDLDRFQHRTEGMLRTQAGEIRTLVWSQSVLRDVDGQVVGACALGMDVTAHRRAEAELAAHRDRLEHLVEQRTIALGESRRKLADAERLASLGRVAAGLSHDLGNMLLPVRCHLDTLGGAQLPPESEDALNAVRTGIEFLEQLGEGLAMLAGASDEDSPGAYVPQERFRLEDWWDKVQPLLQDLVPSGIRFETRFHDGIPEVALPKHLLTRAVMNLLVNSVEALQRSRPERPSIELVAAASEADREIRITLRDNGPGVPDEILGKVAEPFFTTKTRGLSTGLGLSVVDGFARMVGGRFVLESGPEGGAVADLRLPIASVPARDVPEKPPVVEVAIADARLSALCVELLRGLGCIVQKTGKSVAHADHVVTTREEADRGERTGAPPAAAKRIVIDPDAGMAGIRRTLCEALLGEKSAT